MIKLFITDIDGCLTKPFTSPEWDLLAQIRRLHRQSKNDLAVPSLSICSGRPLSYVEAVTQWLGIEGPVVFESAGIFRLLTNEVEFLPAFDDQAERQIEQIKSWLQENIISRHSGMVLEFTKRMDAGIVHLEKGVIDEVYPEVEEFISKEYPRFEVHNTDVSINIILGGNNKRNGIQKLCELYDVIPEEVAYIGDSSGDIPGLKLVGKPFAPQNAAEAVKEHAEVLDESVTKAVLSAYRTIIKANRKKLATTS
jgi:hydroxymethylpyrimidine pyrophosphatase-like HAD family hydrolase